MTKVHIQWLNQEGTIQPLEQGVQLLAVLSGLAFNSEIYSTVLVVHDVLFTAPSKVCAYRL